MKELGKPTKETELLRIWELDKKDKKENTKKYEEDKGFEIDLGNDTKMKAVGFTEIKEKATGKLLFAYKFKETNEGKFILYYNPSKDKKFLELLKIMSIGGYGIQDLEENLKSIKEETKLMDKKK